MRRFGHNAQEVQGAASTLTFGVERLQVVGRIAKEEVRRIVTLWQSGEAFEKVARWLGLGYPGGPEIDRLAHEGSPDALKLPVSMVGDDLDLSFSGLKTAVVRATERHPEVPLADVAASFQRALCEQLLRKLRQALERYDVKGVALAGGVAANSALRSGVTQLAREFAVVCHLPTMAMCTDNAAMIAAAGLFRLRHGGASELNLSASPNWQLAEVS